MQATIKQMLISALVLSLSGAVYAQAAGGGGGAAPLAERERAKAELG